nr:hypothetical protein [uncultured Rhodopila sp.]
MPAKTAASPLSPVDPRIGLRFAAAEHLIPFFRIQIADTPTARRMAHSALDAYYPESRADFINAARTIAFSMAAIALLGKATATPNLTMPEQLRAYGCANALNRSAEQSERSMMVRRAYLHANPQPERPPIPPAESTTISPQDEAEIEARVAEAMQEYRAACARSAAEKQPPQAEAPNPQPAPSAEPPFRTPASLEAALRSAMPGFDAEAGRVTPITDGLLRRGARDGVPGPNGVQRTV